MGIQFVKFFIPAKFIEKILDSLPSPGKLIEINELLSQNVAVLNYLQLFLSLSFELIKIKFALWRTEYKTLFVKCFALLIQKLFFRPRILWHTVISLYYQPEDQLISTLWDFQKTTAMAPSIKRPRILDQEKVTLNFDMYTKYQCNNILGN